MGREGEEGFRKVKKCGVFTEKRFIRISNAINVIFDHQMISNNCEITTLIRRLSENLFPDILSLIIIL